MLCTLLHFVRIIRIFKFNKACKNSQLSYPNRSRNWTILPYLDRLNKFSKTFIDDHRGN